MRDAGVFLGLLGINFGSVVAEGGLEIEKSAVSKLLAIAQEQSPPHDAGIEHQTAMRVFPEPVESASKTRSNCLSWLAG